MLDVEMLYPTICIIIGNDCFAFEPTEWWEVPKNHKKFSRQLETTLFGK